jgi:hypothetical protein
VTERLPPLTAVFSNRRLRYISVAMATVTPVNSRLNSTVPLEVWHHSGVEVKVQS